jgi:hypothetical protein
VTVLLSTPLTANVHSSPTVLLKLLHVWLRATLTPTVFTARTSLRFIACVPSGLVMRMDRAWQASDVSVIVGLGERDALTDRDATPPLRERDALTDRDATPPLRERERERDALCAKAGTKKSSAAKANAQRQEREAGRNRIPRASALAPRIPLRRMHTL